MTKQEAAIKYITENYLDFNRLRHDVIADKLQIRVADSLEDASLQDAPKGLQFRGKEMWREMTKHDINSIVCHAAQEYDANITSREVMTALQSDLIPNVHPLREYVLSCREWTEEQPDWIDFVASQVRVADNASDSEKGSNGSKSSKGESAVEISRTSRTPSTKADTLWRGCFKKWFVAMVASWMKDEVVNHTVLVLVGRQGIFKTTWLERLIPPELREYSSKLPLSGQITKDDRLRLCENAMLNIDELDAICGREMNIVKSLLTSSDVNERAAYGRLKERRVRLASFCASTNNREFLTDITGNRRWLPFEVESIQNPFHAIIPYEQLYAQAVYLIEQGWYMYWFDLEEIEELEKHNEEFRAMENEEQLLPILFDVPAEGKGEFMTTAEISDKLVSYGGIKKPMSIRQLGMLLAKRGFQKKQVYLSGSNVRGWIVYKRQTDEIELLKKIDSHSATSQPTNLY